MLLCYFLFFFFFNFLCKSICCWYSFELHRQVEEIQIGTHNICLYKIKIICYEYSIELHRQVDAIQLGTHNISFYKEVDKKFTGCILKTTELLDCALIGVCAVIRSNTVRKMFIEIWGRVNK